MERLTSNQITGTALKIEKEKELTWHNAWELRKLIQNNFTMNPIFEKNGKIYRIMVRKPTEVKTEGRKGKQKQ